jgi:hypothetical protein
VPPPVPAPKTAAPASTATAEKAHAPASSSSIDLPWITFDMGYAYGDRWFRHSEPSTGELRTYSAVRLHSAAANLAFYPAEKIKLPIWRDVGLTLSYAQAFGVTSNLAGQPIDTSNSAGASTNPLSRGPFATTYRRWDVGIRYRFRPSGGEDAWRWGIGAGYRQWRFDFDVADEPGHEVPRARYPLLRVGFDVEKRFGRLAFLGGIGYLPLLGSVTLGDRASNGFAQGAEVGLGAGYAILPHLRLRASGQYTVFRLSLAPLVGRGDSSGIVWDHYLTLGAGAEVTF